MRAPELLLLVLMVSVGTLGVLAGTIRVPYRILLVLGGLVLGFLPGVPPAELPPELVLVAFLPPLLYKRRSFLITRPASRHAQITLLRSDWCCDHERRRDSRAHPRRRAAGAAAFVLL